MAFHCSFVLKLTVYVKKKQAMPLAPKLNLVGLFSQGICQAARHIGYGEF